MAMVYTTQTLFSEAVQTSYPHICRARLIGSEIQGATNKDRPCVALPLNDTKSYYAVLR